MTPLIRTSWKGTAKIGLLKLLLNTMAVYDEYEDYSYRTTCLYNTIYGWSASRFGNSDTPTATYTRQVQVVSLLTIPAFGGSLEHQLVGVQDADESTSTPGKSIRATNNLVVLRPFAPTREEGHVASCKHWDIYNHDMRIYQIVGRLQQGQIAAFTLAAQTPFRGQVLSVIVGIDLEGDADDEAPEAHHSAIICDTRSNSRIVVDAIVKLLRNGRRALSRLLGL